MTSTHILSKIAIETNSEEFPESTLSAARKMVLDTIGCAIAGHDSEGIASCLEAGRERGGTKQASVLVYGDSLPLTEVAFINGAMIHALDYDDVYCPATLHLMSSMLPAAMAACEKVNGSGRDFLDAIILGIEVSTRLGRACKPLWSQPQGAGFIPSSVIGGFGAVAGASRLLGLSVEETVSAMGIFYAQASGNRQALYDKTLTKRLQPAFASRNALYSADLAKRDVTGPPNAIEGDVGLVRIYMNSEEKFDSSVLNNSFDSWEIENVSVKQFNSCGGCHPIARAALDLAMEEDIKPDNIKEVSIYMGEGESRLTGMPFKLGKNPQVNAQFCSTYSAAVALLRKQVGLKEFTSKQIRKDTEVSELAEKIEVLKHHDSPPEEDPRPKGIQPWASKHHGVFVTTCDGRKLERWCSPIEVLRPDAMDYDAVKEKFYECTDFSGICPKEKADQIINTVENLCDLPGVEQLVMSCKLLSRG